MTLERFPAEVMLSLQRQVKRILPLWEELLSKGSDQPLLPFEGYFNSMGCRKQSPGVIDVVGAVLLLCLS